MAISFADGLSPGSQKMPIIEQVTVLITIAEQGIAVHLSRRIPAEPVISPVK